MLDDTPQTGIRLEDSRAFAALSGDWNPVHRDETRARRSIFVGTVAHGLHTALWALDQFWVDAPPQRIASIRFAFPQPLRRGEAPTWSATTDETGMIHIVAIANAKTVAEVRVSSSDAELHPSTDSIPDAVTEESEPIDRGAAESEGLEGEVSLQLSQEHAEALFPNLVRVLARDQFATILALTRIVGMECPGLHSIFVNATLNFGEPAGEARTLRFRARSVHPVTGYARLDLENEISTGAITAVFRPPPVQQPSFADAQQCVAKDRFSGWRAIVVGGSRGLGEIVTKLLVAGGADVLLTYNQGEDDARRVANACADAPGTVSVIHCDASGPEPFDQRAIDGFEATHLCYFATPPILMNESTRFDPALFDRYCSVYVAGFWNVWRRLSAEGERPLSVLYPSSIAVEEIVPAAAEYACAKMAAETLCRHIEHAYPSTRIGSPRLPRLATDQTLSVLPYDYPDAMELMLGHLESIPGPADA